MQSRFTKPFDSDPLDFLRKEIRMMEHASEKGFELFESSPVAPFGSCSALGPVDQRNVVTALRNSEVVADVTNVIALEIAARKKIKKILGHQKFAACHRHIRAQQFDIPGFTAHFKVMVLVSSGRDQGNYQFEAKTIRDHINTYIEILQQVFQLPKEKLDFKLLIDDTLPDISRTKIQEFISENVDQVIHPVVVIPAQENTYYHPFRFKIRYRHKKEWIEVIDGGSVDWTQKLLQNQKERLIISGLGSEFLYRLIFN